MKKTNKKLIEEAIGYKLLEVKTAFSDCWQVCFNSDKICYKDGDEPVVYIAKSKEYYRYNGCGGEDPEITFRVFNDCPFGVRHGVSTPDGYYSMILQVPAHSTANTTTVKLDGLAEAVEEISCRLIEDDKMLDKPITLRKLFDVLLALDEQPNCTTDVL